MDNPACFLANGQLCAGVEVERVLTRFPGSFFSVLHTTTSLPFHLYVVNAVERDRLEVRTVCAKNCTIDFIPPRCRTKSDKLHETQSIGSTLRLLEPLHSQALDLNQFFFGPRRGRETAKQANGCTAQTYLLSREPMLGLTCQQTIYTSRQTKSNTITPSEACFLIYFIHVKK